MPIQVGVVSDTHGRLPSYLGVLFRNVGMILHAGDVGSSQVLDELMALAPVEAIRGNVDYMDLPPIKAVSIETARFLIMHDIGNPYFLNEAAKHAIQEQDPDVMVFGHTHQADTVLTELYGRPRLLINPGSASKGRNGMPQTAMLMDVAGSLVRLRTFDVMKEMILRDESFNLTSE